MKNKLVSFIIIFLLAFAGFPANAHILEGNTNKVIDKLAEFTPADRENLLTLVFPFITMDSGIDMLVDMINSHVPSSEGLVDEYIAQVLEHAAKEEVSFALNSLKIVPEAVRKQYLSDFMNRKEYPLSDEGNKNMTYFMDIAYRKNDSIKKIVTSDNITNGNIANVFRVIFAANDDMPLVSANGQFIFAPYYISGDVSAKWDAIRIGNANSKNARQLVMSLVDNLNTDYSYDERMRIAKLFSEIGICYIPQDTVSGSFKNISIGASDRMGYNAIFAFTENGKLLYRTKFTENAYKRVNFADCEGWYAGCVSELAYMGIISGRGDGLFYPNDFVTREEFVKMICAAVNLPQVNTKTTFNDVDNSAWYAGYINSAYAHKIIKGQSAEKFGIGNHITRQDAAVICNNILKDLNLSGNQNINFADKDLISPYASESVNKLASLGILKGNDKGYFNPKLNITRAESAKIINEMIYLIANTK